MFGNYLVCKLLIEGGADANYLTGGFRLVASASSGYPFIDRNSTPRKLALGCARGAFLPDKAQSALEITRLLSHESECEDEMLAEDSSSTARTFWQQYVDPCYYERS